MRSGWAAASPLVDGAGNIWVATGNSAFGSSSDAYDYSDGVIELSSSLVVQDDFAPSTWYSDNAADADLGSSSPALMGNGLVYQAGKSKTGFVMSQSALGGVNGQLRLNVHVLGQRRGRGQCGVGEHRLQPRAWVA